MPDLSVNAYSYDEARRKLNHPGQLYLSCIFFETVKVAVVDDAGRKSEVFERTGRRCFTFNTSLR
jgi:hypothetical protein